MQIKPVKKVKGVLKTYRVKTGRKVKKYTQTIHARYRLLVEGFKPDKPMLTVTLVNYFYAYGVLEALKKTTSITLLKKILIEFGKRVRKEAAEIISDGKKKGMPWADDVSWHRLTIWRKQKKGYPINSLMCSKRMLKAFSTPLKYPKRPKKDESIILNAPDIIFEIRSTKFEQRKRTHGKRKGEGSKKRARVSEKIRVRIGTDIPYAALIELGGQNDEGFNVPSRPFLLPAYIIAFANFDELVREVTSKHYAPRLKKLVKANEGKSRRISKALSPEQVSRIVKRISTARYKSISQIRSRVKAFLLFRKQKKKRRMRLKKIRRRR